MATKIAERSTYWAISDGPKVNNKPYQDGDYRYYWKIYYEQTEEDKKPWNNRSKVIVDYYIQTYKSTSVYADVVSYPSGSSTTKIDNSTLKTISTKSGSIVIGDDYKQTYIGSASKYIYHNATGDGTFTWQGSGFGMGTATSTYTLPHINRYSITSVIDTFDIDNGFSTTITKYVSSYYDKLEVIVAGEVIKTINNAKDTIEIVFTENELDRIYAIVPTGATTEFIVKTTTYTNSSMNTVVGSYEQKPIGRFNIILPTVNGAICTDDMDQHEMITGDSTMQTIIKGISLINVSIPTNMQAVANTRGATISEYVIEGLHVKYNASGTLLQLVQFDENDKPIYETYSQKDHILIYAVDSRGTSSLVYEQKFTKYIPYEPVTVNTKTRQIGRQNNGVSRFIDVSFEGTWWNGNFGALQNALTPIVYYRDAEDGYWNDLNEFVEGAQVGQIDMSLVDTSTPGVFKYSGPVSSSESDKGFDISINYDMLIGFWDLLTNMVLIVTVPYGEPAIAVYKNKAALGGPYDESLGGTQLWGDIYVNGEPHGSGGGSDVDVKRHAISAQLSADVAYSLTAWTTELVTFNKYITVGDKFTPNAENNKIVIGPGVRKIKVNGCASFVNLPATVMRAWCIVYDNNGTWVDSTYVSTYNPSNQENALIHIPERLYEVGEGWSIGVGIQIGLTKSVSVSFRTTSLYIEVME